MAGEIALERLLETLSVMVHEDVFVFVTLGDGKMPASLSPQLSFQETEGLSLILTKAEAEAHGYGYEFESKMITLNVHSSLDAVGFIAHIAAGLAKESISVNPVAGFYHDHLFVPVNRLDDALDVLENHLLGEA